MAFQSSILPIVLNGTGTEIPVLNTTDNFDFYTIRGAVTSIGNYAIVPTGVATNGLTFLFEYKGIIDITTNNNTFSIFGASITQEQLLKSWKAVCVYNGTSWDVLLQMDFSEAAIISSSNLGANVIVNTNIADNSIDLGVKGLDLSLTNAKIAAATIVGSTKLVDNSVTDVKINSVNGSKIANTTVTNGKLSTMANNTMKANISGGVAVPSDVSISSIINTNAWSTTGNSGTVAGTNFIGTTDAIDVVFKVSNVESGRLNTTNTSFGYLSSDSNISSNGNSSFGAGSLFSNTGGLSNTAIGNGSLFNNTGSFNTSIGKSSLNNISTGNGNTGLGYNSGVTLQTGSNNTLIGSSANVDSSSAMYRIAIGQGSISTLDYQFAIPTNITTVRFQAATITSEGLAITSKAINTTTGDIATINAVAGRFRKDNSGTTFTLTNSYITANSIVMLQIATVGLTAGNNVAVVAGSGVTTITFQSAAGIAEAPNASADVNFWVIN